MEKTDILFIHGGMTFKKKKEYYTYLEKYKSIYLDPKISWSGKYLSEKLGRKYRIIRANMPMADDAKYKDWEIYFKRYLPLLNKKFILIGQSLGGIFLAKFLSENKLRKKPKAVYLIAPPFDNTLTGEDLVGGFALKGDLSLIEKNTKNLTLFFSQDDDVVSVAHAEKYRKKLPDANIKIFKSKNGHFKITSFPEIVKMIKENK